MAKKVVNSEWLDSDTFVVYFENTPTSEKFELEGVTEEVVVEYHKDEKEWVVDKQYYDAEGGFIDHDTKAFTPYEEAEYLTIAQGVLRDLEDDGKIEVRITFRSEVYIKGKTLEEIKEKWKDLPIFSADALETYSADFVELVSAERVDDDSYEDININ